MNYVYIIAPIGLSLILFTLTIGCLLLVKYRTDQLLKSIRQRLILERCDPEFVAKPPDVSFRPEPFIGVYREPSPPLVHQGYYKLPPSNRSGINGSRSMHSIDSNSE